MASSGSACAGDEGDAVGGSGSRTPWVDVGDGDMVGSGKAVFDDTGYIWMHREGQVLQRTWTRSDLKKE